MHTPAHPPPPTPTHSHAHCTCIKLNTSSFFCKLFNLLCLAATNFSLHRFEARIGSSSIGLRPCLPRSSLATTLHYTCIKLNTSRFLYKLFNLLCLTATSAFIALRLESAAAASVCAPASPVAA
jgi:hypothetical protein